MAVASEADEFTWDIDGDGKEAPLTDGLLIIRYLFGFTDQALIQGAVDSNATRSTAADITAYLDAHPAELDVDGNAKNAPLSDGLLIIRYLFGFDGASLVQNAVAPDGARTTADDISAFLDARSGGGSIDPPIEPPTVTAKAYFEDEVAGLIDRCVSCHKAGAVAGGTDLVFVLNTTENLDTNYKALRDFILDTSQPSILGKISGVSHPGGNIYPTNSDGYKVFEEFVRLVEEEDASGEEEPEPVTNAFNTLFKSSTLLSAEATLRRATILLLGRNPTLSEISLLSDGSDAALRQAIRAATEDPAFHDFLVRGANDRLLTDAFVEGIPLEQASLEANAFYPLGTNAHADAQADAGERFLLAQVQSLALGPCARATRAHCLHCEQRP